MLAWANFGLGVAAVLKFIPIVVSLAQGLVLSPQQAAAGMADERAWALDLISDTPYLLMSGFGSPSGCGDRRVVSDWRLGASLNVRRTRYLEARA